jgi:hypothetical protein
MIPAKARARRSQVVDEGDVCLAQEHRLRFVSRDGAAVIDAGDVRCPWCPFSTREGVMVQTTVLERRSTARRGTASNATAHGGDRLVPSWPSPGEATASAPRADQVPPGAPRARQVLSRRELRRLEGRISGRGIRRSDEETAKPAPGVEVQDRRAGMERREYVPNHHITVGRVAGSGGWMGGVCSCGEHMLSRVEGFIEDWARDHRRKVIDQTPLFVHTS